MAKKKEDDLADTIADGINKLLKEDKSAFVKDEDTPASITGYVSTGCAMLDLAISNKPNGGIALGRIVEFTGLEASGKSLVAAHIMANVQKMGGVAVLIDTEVAMNKEFFDAVGINRGGNFIYVHNKLIENIFAIVENAIESVKKSEHKDRPVVIVIDSIAGATTKAESEADYDKQGYNTDKAILIGQALRKITSTIAKEKIALVITNQLRQKMNAMPFADPWIAPGGKALPFFASTRIRFALTGKIKNKDKEVIGVSVKANVEKNRIGPPHRSANFSIFFDRGIDDFGSWLEFLREKGIVTGPANALVYISHNGTEHKFHESNWTSLLESNPKLKEEVYLKLCNTCITSYQTKGLASSDVETEPVTEE